jgi:SEL1 protein
MYFKYYWEWITGHEVGPALPSDGNNSHQKKSRKEVEESNWDDMAEEMKHKYKIMKQKEREEHERLGDDVYVSDDPYDLDDLSEEDELIDSLLILGLCILVGYLVYVRQFRFGAGNNRGAPGAAPQQPNNNNNIQ